MEPQPKKTFTYWNEPGGLADGLGCLFCLVMFFGLRWLAMTYLK